jgi:broad specificity phosphatase PhoE
VLSGLQPDEAAERYPRPEFIHPYMPIGSSGESQWDLYLRAGQAVKSLVQRQPGCYVVVSHGGILNLVLYAILGIAPQANFHGPRFRFRNTAYATLTYSPLEHKWSLLGLNERNHWQDGEDTLPAPPVTSPSAD